MMTRLRAAVAATVALAPALASCGSGTATTSTPSIPAATATASASSVPAATSSAVPAGKAAPVARNLKSLDALGKKVAGTSDSAQAKTEAEGLEKQWAPIEDEVKSKDKDAYTSIEDAMALLKTGDPAKAGKGSAQLSEAVRKYLAKYPG